MTWAQILTARWSLVRRKGRSRTRVRLEWSTTLVRWMTVVLKMDRSYEAGRLNTVTAFCMSCISASERRKASVDSAP